MTKEELAKARKLASAALKRPSGCTALDSTDEKLLSCAFLVLDAENTALRKALKTARDSAFEEAVKAAESRYSPTGWSADYKSAAAGIVASIRALKGTGDDKK